MKTGLTLQRFGGVAAIVHAVAFVAGPVTLALVIASLGLRAGDMADPAKALPAVLKSYGGFAAWGLMYVLVGATVLVMALAFDQRLREGATSLVRAATATGLIATAFFVAAGVLEMSSLAEIALRYSANHDQAGAAYLAFQAVADGLLSAASLTYGAWLVMAFWAAIRVKAFSRGLNYFGFIWGIVAMLAPFSSDLATFQILGPVWALWMGVVLLRSPAVGTPAVPAVAGPSSVANGRLPLSPELPETSEA
jgi:hypothetical protein